MIQLSYNTPQQQGRQATQSGAGLQSVAQGVGAVGGAIANIGQLRQRKHDALQQENMRDAATRRQVALEDLTHQYESLLQEGKLDEALGIQTQINEEFLNPESNKYLGLNNFLGAGKPPLDEKWEQHYQTQSRVDFARMQRSLGAAFDAAHTGVEIKSWVDRMLDTSKMSSLATHNDPESAPVSPAVLGNLLGQFSQHMESDLMANANPATIEMARVEMSKAIQQHVRTAMLDMQQSTNPNFEQNISSMLKLISANEHLVPEIRDRLRADLMKAMPQRGTSAREVLNWSTNMLNDMRDNPQMIGASRLLANQIQQQIEAGNFSSASEQTRLLEAFAVFDMLDHSYQAIKNGDVPISSFAYFPSSVRNKVQDILTTVTGTGSEVSGAEDALRVSGGDIEFMGERISRLSELEPTSAKQAAQIASLTTAWSMVETFQGTAEQFEKAAIEQGVPEHLRNLGASMVKQIREPREAHAKAVMGRLLDYMQTFSAMSDEEAIPAILGLTESFHQVSDDILPYLTADDRAQWEGILGIFRFLEAQQLVLEMSPHDESFKVAQELLLNQLEIVREHPKALRKFDSILRRINGVSEANLNNPQVLGELLDPTIQQDVSEMFSRALKGEELPRWELDALRHRVARVADPIHNSGTSRKAPILGLRSAMDAVDNAISTGASIDEIVPFLTALRRLNATEGKLQTLNYNVLTSWVEENARNSQNAGVAFLLYFLNESTDNDGNFYGGSVPASFTEALEVYADRSNLQEAVIDFSGDRNLKAAFEQSVGVFHEVKKLAAVNDDKRANAAYINLLGHFGKRMVQKAEGTLTHNPRAETAAEFQEKVLRKAAEFMQEVATPMRREADIGFWGTLGNIVSLGPELLHRRAGIDFSIPQLAMDGLRSQHRYKEVDTSAFRRLMAWAGGEGGSVISPEREKRAFANAAVSLLVERVSDQLSNLTPEERTSLVAQLNGMGLLSLARGDQGKIVQEQIDRLSDKELLSAFERSLRSNTIDLGRPYRNNRGEFQYNLWGENVVRVRQQAGGTDVTSRETVQFGDIPLTISFSELINRAIKMDEREVTAPQLRDSHIRYWGAMEIGSAKLL